MVWCGLFVIASLGFNIDTVGLMLWGWCYDCGLFAVLIWGGFRVCGLW